MTSPPAAASQPARDAPGTVARGLVREAWKATLGTLARDGGHPYGSLVAVAAEPEGTPLLLLSGLAEHTKNIASDQRASLLFDGTGRGRGALTGARVTLVGTLAEARSDTARRRYLARHPDASGFVDFGDFKLYALDVAWAHLVAGFGRIQRLQRTDVILSTAGAEGVLAAEESILEHMNTDHADTLGMLAERLGGAQSSGNPEAWQMIGCDPEGFDLAAADTACRVLFPQRVNSPDEVRRALVAMCAAARAPAAKAGK